MHGQHDRVLCNNCGQRFPWDSDLSRRIPCPACHSAGTLRPDVVWFGEMPYHMSRIAIALRTTELFVSIGTSGSVYPAAGFVQQAREHGAHTIELNLEPSEGISFFAEAYHGKATDIVPAFVERVLARAG
jgi:NAD-dependent deacetylase